MTALVLICGGLWLCVCTVVILLFLGGCKSDTPRQPLTQEQLAWMKASAKVAGRTTA